MAVAAACPRCGRPVRPGEVFCGTCGTPLGFEPTAGSVLPLVGPDEGARRVTQLVSRAEVGLLLLIGAALTSWVPAIVWVGGLLGIAGAALLLAGREPFGAAHTRNVAVALFLVIGAGVGVDLIRMSLDTAVASAVQLGPAAAPRAIFAAFQDFLFLSVIVSFVSGLGYVLLAYALEDTVGRLALATALALLVFLNVAIYVAVMGQLGPALNAAFSSTSRTPDPCRTWSLRWMPTAYSPLSPTPCTPARSSLPGAGSAAGRFRRVPHPFPSPFPRIRCEPIPSGSVLGTAGEPLRDTRPRVRRNYASLDGPEARDLLGFLRPMPHLPDGLAIDDVVLSSLRSLA